MRVTDRHDMTLAVKVALNPNTTSNQSDSILWSVGLTLVIMTIKFEFLEEEGNVLLIIVSLRGTDLEVGVLWYGMALLAEGKQILLLCKATSMLNVMRDTF